MTNYLLCRRTLLQGVLFKI